MKLKIITLLLVVFTISIYAQEFEKGTIITKRYDTIKDVQIEKMNDSKSILHINYIDADGLSQSPDIETIKCYTRGDEMFCRIYNSGEMVMAKKIASGEKLNLYLRDNSYYIEKVFDELIKVPSSNSKFSKVLSDFLSESPQIADKIKSQELKDILEIVNLYNKG
ncbi:hypothetical protein [Lutibacter sp.]|uniref:hypothetical protein n=1 Tax=Lutibacter sp. TaxID=1925666 RepID=UPI001A2BFD11|nr:hypothetical protein [Lutibacter sp.]MBI9039985.1 hypothetical protein [Lutibacter sp.]